jgi:hypothetical protein
MNNLFTFLIQSSIGMLLFYAVYWLFLRKETYYSSNRFFLLFALISSFLLPLVPIQYKVIVEGGVAGSNLFTEVGTAIKSIRPYAGSGFAESFSINWGEVLLIIYLTGAAIFLLRLLVQTVILIIQIIKTKTILLDGLRIIETEKYGLPFSFFNVVYINPKFHKQKNLPEILAHEKVHIREKHWVDLLIIELLTVIFWFNPIIWFFEHSIKLNHEYLADRGVISNGSHLGKYQALLVNQLMGMQIIGLTNNLNFGISANRLKMMTKQKTPKIKAMKLVWAMPVVAILLFAFAEPNYKVMQPKSEADFIINQDREIKFSGTVVNEDGYGFPGVSIIVPGTSIGTTTDLDGSFTLNIQKNDKIIFSFIGMSSVTIIAASSKNDVGNEWTLEKKIMLKKAAILLDLDKMFFGDPPPPPPKKAKGKKAPPPPPPRKQFNEKGEEEIFMLVEAMPEYPGGFKALGSYITEMQQKLAKSEHIKGKVKVGFTVGIDGKASDIKIISKDNDLVAKGAATIVKGMKTWASGKQRNKPAPVDFILPLEF